MVAGREISRRERRRLREDRRRAEREAERAERLSRLPDRPLLVLACLIGIAALIVFAAAWGAS